MGSKTINDISATQSVLNATDEFELQETGGGTSKKILMSTIEAYIGTYVEAYTAVSRYKLAETVQTVADETTTIDWDDGYKVHCTLEENTTFDWTAPDKACMLLFKIVQDTTGSRTLTFIPTIKWAGGNSDISTAANSIDIISIYFDGTNYWGMLGLAFA